ncbi:hypothetical protein DVH24_021041 [Malus domestica]|uniref:Uncharacterized protein n=1 Tax=Malus domestica TaxID=3750 RepID=A0A498J8K6_MALDO|nr:hypothetical protein DVH24_021041 [Malus domestica]
MLLHFLAITPSVPLRPLLNLPTTRFPKSDFCFWVLHLSPIQSVKGEPSMTLKVMTNKTLRQCLNSKLLALRD